jgi:TRAP transporter TAXI family solute receptor
MGGGDDRLSKNKLTSFYQKISILSKILLKEVAMKKLFFVIFLMILMGSTSNSYWGIVALAQTPSEKWPKQIILGSFVKGSEQYPTMMAAAQLITKYTPATAIIREYGGGTPLWEALMRGDIDTWSIGYDEFHNAYYGKGFWKGKPQDIALLTGAWIIGTTGFGVRPNEGIKSLKDLAGKKCLVQSNILGQNKAVEAAMRNAGVWEKATILKLASTAEIAPAMIDKKVDCFFWSIMAGYTLEIKRSVGLELIPLTKEEQQAAVNACPGMIPRNHPRPEMHGYLPGAIIPTIGYVMGIVARANMPDYNAYGIVKAWYEEKHLDEVRSLSPSLETTTIENACKYFWNPFHPGAVKFYKEKGFWTSEMEKRQKELLAAPR